MADKEKSLEMRVAELEDKLAQLHVTEDEMKAYHKVSSLLGGGGGASACAPCAGGAGAGAAAAPAPCACGSVSPQAGCVFGAGAGACAPRAGPNATAASRPQMAAAGSNLLIRNLFRLRALRTKVHRAAGSQH